MHLCPLPFCTPQGAQRNPLKGTSKMDTGYSQGSRGPPLATVGPLRYKGDPLLGARKTPNAQGTPLALFSVYFV